MYNDCNTGRLYIRDVHGVYGGYWGMKNELNFVVREVGFVYY